MNRAWQEALEAWKTCRGHRAASDTQRPTTFAEVVRAYRRDYQVGARAERDYYSNLPSLREAIERAARAERPDGLRHDHQTRIRRRALLQVQRTLNGESFRSCHSFEELHEFLHGRLDQIPGIGELMIYDTALRIGPRLGFEPAVVYLHRGTRIGAASLGLDAARPFLEMGEFPAEFRSLRPHEIEDCVCIYKDELRSISARRFSRARA